MLKTNEYYIFEQLNETVTIRYEIWSGVYGDCLVSTKVEFTGSFDEAKQWLIDNKIEEVITR